MGSSDFGRYLTQQRELRGMSREQVASATKISLALVSALEEGDVQKLPSRVFVMNFIRSYAQVIGIEPEDAVLRFQEEGGGPEERPAAMPRPVASIARPKGRAWAAILLAGVAIALLLAWALARDHGALHR